MKTLSQLLLRSLKWAAMGVTISCIIVCQVAAQECDLDGDGDCDVADIDSLIRSFWDSPPDPDPNVQVDEWLAAAGPQNGFAGSLKHGDANLDGVVDSTDLNALGKSWLQTGKVWSEGNFGCFDNGSVDACDLMNIGINWQSRVPVASAPISVPEPTGYLLFAIGAAVLFRISRQTGVSNVLVSTVLVLTIWTRTTVG